MLIVNGINPLLNALFARMSLRAREILAGTLGVLFVSDFVLTCFMLKLVRTGVESSQADNTEEISREVRLLLSDRNVFYKRFAEAYPEVIYRTERVTARMEAIRAETERLRREAEQRLAQGRVQVAGARDAVAHRLAQGREQVASALESNASIRNTLLEDQQALIALMYTEAEATDEMRALKRDIDRNRDRLKARRAMKAEKA